MSHSQFHSTNLFILRHAWLNLWDKHMTTGRINQVTTIPWSPLLGDIPLRSMDWSFVHHDQHREPISITSTTRHMSHTAKLTSSSLPCSPDLTYLRQASLCPDDLDHCLRWGLPATGDIAQNVSQSRRILEWLIVSGIAISNQSTPFTSCQHQILVFLKICKPPRPVLPNQYILTMQAHPWPGPDEASHNKTYSTKCRPWWLSPVVLFRPALCFQPCTSTR